MKFRFIIFTVFLFASLIAKGQWTAIPSGTTANLSEIVFRDSLTGYILANGNTNTCQLLKTTDGGNTWNSVLNNYQLKHFDFINKDTGVVIKSDTVFKTYDGGITWSSLSIMPTTTSFLFHMNTADEWFDIVGQGVAYTTDGGASWYSGAVFGTIPIIPTDFQFVNDSTVVGVGWYPPKSFISTDKGLHWTQLGFFQPTGSGMIWSDCFISPAIGFATGNNRILKTIDGGINWTKIDSTLGIDIYCIRNIDANNFYGVGYGGGIAKTIDGGISWTTETSGTSNNLHKIIFVNSHKAIAIGDSGTILMNTNITTGISTSISTENIITVFPNPINNTVTFQVNATGNFQLSFYNSLGQIIITKTFQSGENSIDLAAYSNGIYFYKFTSADKHLITNGKIIKQ